MHGTQCQVIRISMQNPFITSSTTTIPMLVKILNQVLVRKTCLSSAVDNSDFSLPIGIKLE